MGLGRLNMTLDDERKMNREKHEWLCDRYTYVAPSAFYRAVFPEGEMERRSCPDDAKANAIAIQIFDNGRAHKSIVFDGLEELDGYMGADFAIISPITYCGRNRSSRNARWMYALAIDLDGVGMRQMNNVVHQMEHAVIPKATYVVNSGYGLHLYYLFDDPVPLYPKIQRQLKEMKYELARHIWNKYTSTIQDVQQQGIAQGFRMVGSWSKLGRGYPVTAYETGYGRVTIDYLNGFVDDGHKVDIVIYKSKMTLDEAMAKYPEWYNRRIINKEPKKRWHIKRALYDWWLRRITYEIGVGHRYFGIMCLAIYAAKCDIDEDELYDDAFGLLERYDSLSVTPDNSFTKEDIVAALQAYAENYVTFPRNDIEKISGIPIPVNKRNGRKRSDHLKIMNFIRDMEHPNGEWRRGNGRKSAQDIVFKWRDSCPDGRKCDCIRDTGLSKPTVYKYFGLWKP